MATTSPLIENTLYYVTEAGTGEILATYATLAAAKKDAKARGKKADFTGREFAVAYVAADIKRYDGRGGWTNDNPDRVVVYYPR